MGGAGRESRWGQRDVNTSLMYKILKTKNSKIRLHCKDELTQGLDTLLPHKVY